MASSTQFHSNRAHHPSFHGSIKENRKYNEISGVLNNKLSRIIPPPPVKVAPEATPIKIDPETLPVKATPKKLQGKVDPVAKKWNQLKLDPALLKADYESAKFLVESKLIYSILGFQNSTPKGSKNHAILLDPRKKMMIKKQGQWVPVSELKGQLKPGGNSNLFVDEQGQAWNYISPVGLAPVNRFGPEDTVPVEQLSKAEMQELLAHAHQYSKGKKDPSKKCIMQIVMNRNPLTSNDEGFFVKNAAKYGPNHVYFRIITEDGKVYSQGLSNIDADLRTQKPFNFFMSLNGQPALLDFDEFKIYQGKVVTSVPIDTKTAEKILKQINDQRREGVRFNIANQNCVCLLSEMLKNIDVEIDTQMSFKHIVSQILPNAKDIPVIGPVIDKTRRVASQCFEKLASLTPEVVKIPLRFIKATVLFIPDRLTNLAYNLLLIMFGARKGSEQQQHSNPEAKPNPNPFKKFHNIIPSITGIFGDAALYVHHPLPILQWMLQQDSTTVHSYHGPSLGVLPPGNETLKRESEELKNSFKSKFLG
jgi:hypothetical protein